MENDSFKYFSFQLSQCIFYAFYPRKLAGSKFMYSRILKVILGISGGLSYQNFGLLALGEGWIDLTVPLWRGTLVLLPLPITLLPSTVRVCFVLVFWFITVFHYNVWLSTPSFWEGMVCSISEPFLFFFLSSKSRPK